MGQTRESVDALGSAPPQQTRSKVDFSDLCGSLEDLIYIGEGSNGVVYSASWHGARVAVKFLLGNNDDSTHRQRCFTEAVLTRVLSHPCVVQCFATAIAQLTPEVWEGIRARCRRHQSLLQSSSLGRSVANAMLLQQEQELLHELPSEGADPQAHVHPAFLPNLGSLRRTRQQQQLLQQQGLQTQQGVQAGQRQPNSQHGSQHGSQQGSLGQQPSPRSSLHHQHPHPAVQSNLRHPPQQPQCPLPAQLARVSHQSTHRSQSNSLLALSLPPPVHAPAPALQGPEASQGCCSGADGRAGTTDRLLLEMCKAEQLFTESPAELEGEGGDAGGEGGMLGLGPGGSRDATGNRSSAEYPYEAGASQPNGASSEGISLMQALIDLKAETGRHCTVVVMEYMDAGTLHHAIVRGDFSARRSQDHRTKLLALLLTLQELAQGMAHLHALDILHGDLKPTNVLLKGTPCHYMSGPGVSPMAGGSVTSFPGTDPRGYSIKIADLGLARTCPGETAALSSDQWGALAYLAPEAAKGSCCKASDVYSFGVMLWEMSAGVRPYLGLTTPQVLMGLVTGTLQLTWPSDGSLYAPLRSLAIACTDMNPAERPTFEVAARILGRMVRHIRTACEPLRQRHSSALSMETGGGHGAGCGSNTGSGGANGKCVLNHASRSMSMYPPNALPQHALALGPGTPGSSAQTPAQAAALAAGMLSSSKLPTAADPGCLWTANSVGGATAAGGDGDASLACGGSNAGGPPQSSGWSCQAVRFGGSGAVPSGRCDADTRRKSAGPAWNATGLPVAGVGAEASSGNLAGSGVERPGGRVSHGTQSNQQQQQALPFQQPAPIPRAGRRGVGGNLCGAPVRSPLGASASLRMLPSTPHGGRDPVVWCPAPTPSPLASRPGSSPAHAHVDV